MYDHVIQQHRRGKIGVRALRQHLISATASVLGRLIAAGRATAPTRDLLALPARAAAVAPGEPGTRQAP